MMPDSWVFVVFVPTTLFTCRYSRLSFAKSLEEEDSSRSGSPRGIIVVVLRIDLEATKRVVGRRRSLPNVDGRSSS